MALKRSAVKDGSTIPDTYKIEEVPESIKRDRWERPLIDILDGEGKVVGTQAYTRASTLGKAIEDTYHLDKWKQRCVAYGMSRRKDLVALAASVESNEGDDRKALDEICDKAHEAAKGDSGANIGTALHLLSERADKGEDLSWLPDIILEAIERYAECMTYCRVLATEIFVVCDELETAGSFDRVVELLVDLEFMHKGIRTVIPAGTILILDLKTGKLASAKYWGADYGAQQTVYANGIPYHPTRGRITWSEVLGEDVEPNKEWALILHVPGDSPQDAGFVLVDLEIGAEMAGLAVEVRTMRKVKGLMSDAYPLGEPVKIQKAAKAIDDAIEESSLTTEEAIEALEDEVTMTTPVKLVDDDSTSPTHEPAQVTRLKIVAAILKTECEEDLLEIAEMAIEDGLWDEDCKRAARVRQMHFEHVEAQIEEATWD